MNGVFFHSLMYFLFRVYFIYDILTWLVSFISWSKNKFSSLFDHKPMNFISSLLLKNILHVALIANSNRKLNLNM